MLVKKKNWQMILIQTVDPYMCAKCCNLCVGHPQACLYKENLNKEDIIRI